MTTERKAVQFQQCPFSKTDCIKTQCAIYNDKANNCALPLIAYNLWKLEATIGRLPVSPLCDGAFKLPGA
jgi:hypothetical protein